MRCDQRCLVEEISAVHFDISSISSSTISRIFSVLLRASSASLSDDRVEQLAVERERAPREILAVERMVPEALERFAHLPEQLPEQRVVRGVVDGEVKGQVLGTRRAGGEMDALHLDQLFLDGAEVGGGAPPRRDHACLGLDAAAHLQRLQQCVAQQGGVERQRHVDGAGGDRLDQIGAAALAGLR